MAALALIVTACGGGGKSGGGAGSGGGGKKLALVVGLKGDEFFLTMNCAAQAEAKKLGATLSYQGGDEWSPDKQTPIVNAVAASKPDGVLIGPTDSKAMYAPIKQLADNGAKIALIDTTLEKADTGAPVPPGATVEPERGGCRMQAARLRSYHQALTLEDLLTGDVEIMRGSP
jgi:ABC-type sugar transport system substrate-binding protein